MLDEHVCEYECELSYRGELNYPSFPSLVTKKKKTGHPDCNADRGTFFKRV